jgi:hypothetical protein
MGAKVEHLGLVQYGPIGGSNGCTDRSPPGPKCQRPTYPDMVAKHSGAASQDHAGYGIAAKQFRANPLARNSARRQTPAASNPARSARYLGLNQA